jgi:hypothetical protein
MQDDRGVRGVGGDGTGWGREREGGDRTGVRTGEVEWGGGLNRADSATDAVFFEP